MGLIQEYYQTDSLYHIFSHKQTKIDISDYLLYMILCTQSYTGLVKKSQIFHTCIPYPWLTQFDW